MFWFFDFFSFLSETHLSYLAWSWFFFWFWASADSNFFFFSFLSSTAHWFISLILSKYPFLVSPSLFLSVHLVGNVHIPPLPQAQVSQSVSQSAPYARYPLPFSTSFISVVFSLVHIPIQIPAGSKLVIPNLYVCCQLYLLYWVLSTWMVGKDFSKHLLLVISFLGIPK